MRVRSGGSSGNAAQAENVECWGIDPTGSFFVLASGIGANAERASQMVCETVIQTLLPHRESIEKMASGEHPDSCQNLMETLCNAMRRAERRLLDYMSTAHETKSVASCDLVYLANGTAYIAHIGNQRVYLLRGDTGRLLTIDHSAYEYWRAQGKPESALANPAYRLRVTRALGIGGTAEIDTLQLDLRTGDRIVVCSQGAHQHFQNATHLAQLYRMMEPQRVADYLIQYAFDRGCQTCASVICIEILEPGVRNAFVETDSRITALEQICFFRDLSYQEMLQIMPITYEKGVEAGREIIHEGDAGDVLYILVDGKCEVSNGGVRIAILEPGCSFGELSLVDRQPRSATVKAIGACRVLMIRAGDFEHLTMSGALAVKLLWNVAHELSERIRKSSETIRLQGVRLLENGILN